MHSFPETSLIVDLPTYLVTTQCPYSTYMAAVFKYHAEDLDREFDPLLILANVISFEVLSYYCIANSCEVGAYPPIPPCLNKQIVCLLWGMRVSSNVLISSNRVLHDRPYHLRYGKKCGKWLVLCALLSSILVRWLEGRESITLDIIVSRAIFYSDVAGKP